VSGERTAKHVSSRVVYYCIEATALAAWATTYTRVPYCCIMRISKALLTQVSLLTEVIAMKRRLNELMMLAHWPRACLKGTLGYTNLESDT
jgi:hypothetical protein